ncbi:hypothetical protein CWC05_03615 [Pseudoalteromonas ruthenica]|uniref:Uncharacterized protein n=1 Tax=Pseudoalteromonas ruthenica TaxID=151081 RepID=A0A5S3Z9G9_9GAMM|nr:hypothetical protein [Pseudoalteromonas ruthenica]TMP88530.1 hypothetical protein CWC05_03615 [Pseudoalteromonas ruthenica]|tara:strand:+ start:60705 stop:61295 length:591 start_codon:yes stop_codon:yes gene_type:complete
MSDKFNKIYSVSVDPDEFLLLCETGFEQTIQLTEGQLLLFDGTSMEGNWRTLGVDWLTEPSAAHQNLAKPDIAGLGASTFVVSPKFSHLFLNGFAKNVELLECNLNGEQWFTFNVVGFEDALNEEHSVRNIKNGKPSRVRKFKKMVFTKSAIENPELFRVREAGLRYFTTDARNSLYTIVKEHDIKGIFFNEVEAV